MKNVSFADSLRTTRTLTKHDFAILDLDGTIADNKHRIPLIQREGEQTDWSAYNKAIPNDGFNSHIYKMYCYLCGHYPTIRRIVLTGRSDSCRYDTIKWLEKHKIEIDEIYFRADNDYRKNGEVKLDMINKLKVEGLKPLFAMEDDINTCAVLHEAKIYTYFVSQPSHIVPYTQRLAVLLDK